MPSAAEIYRVLTAAGYTPAAAIVQTAIAEAESGGSDTQLGDVGLEDNTWGPSYGMFQIRTLKAQTGTGSDRDISFLAASDANQAKAAYDISAHGANFSPWTTYTRGTYQKFLPDARAAAAAAGDTSSSTGPAIAATPAGWLDGVAGKFQSGAMVTVFVLGGLVLAGFGLTRAVRGRGQAGAR